MNEMMGVTKPFLTARDAEVTVCLVTPFYREVLEIAHTHKKKKKKEDTP